MLVRDLNAFIFAQKLWTFSVNDRLWSFALLCFATVYTQTLSVQYACMWFPCVLLLLLLDTGGHIGPSAPAQPGLFRPTSKKLTTDYCWPSHTALRMLILPTSVAYSWISGVFSLLKKILAHEVTLKNMICLPQHNYGNFVSPSVTW